MNTILLCCRTLDLDSSTVNNDIPQLSEDYHRILNAPSKENHRHFEELCGNSKCY